MRLPTSGRTQHTHKITVYMSAEELHRLDTMTAHIRYKLGVRADRGRVVREALALAYKELMLAGEDSTLVRRASERKGAA
jgi:hypothetical protein